MGTTVTACICCGGMDLVGQPAVWMPFISHRALNLPPLDISPEFGLQTIPSGRAFALCESLFCRSCGHLFPSYRFSDNEMSQLYNQYRGKQYTKLRDSYEPGYELRNRNLTSGTITYIEKVEEFILPFLHTNSPAVLDWGGDTGANTPFHALRSLHHIYEPSGVQPDSDAAISFAEHPPKTNNYDLIVLANVLEHLPYPLKTLQQITHYMTDKTILYIEVPFERLQMSNRLHPLEPIRSKHHWHEHINFFSETSLTYLCSSAQLNITQLRMLDISTSKELYGVSANYVMQALCCL